MSPADSELVARLDVWAKHGSELHPAEQDILTASARRIEALAAEIQELHKSNSDAMTRIADANVTIRRMAPVVEAARAEAQKFREVLEQCPILVREHGEWGRPWKDSDHVGTTFGHWDAWYMRRNAALAQAPTQEEAPKVVTENDAASSERTDAPTSSMNEGGPERPAIQAATVTSPVAHLERARKWRKNEWTIPHPLRSENLAAEFTSVERAAFERAAGIADALAVSAVQDTEGEWHHFDDMFGGRQAAEKIAAALRAAAGAPEEPR